MSRARLRVLIGPGRLTADIEGSPAGTWAWQSGFAGSPDLIDSLSRLGEAARRDRQPRRALVVVQQPLAQRRTLSDLPPVPRAELSRLVARGAPRYFRQNGHPLVSAAMWTGDTTASTRIAAAAAIDIELAEAVVAGSAKGGLQLDDILPESSSPALSLLPPSEIARRRRRAWLTTSAVAVAAMLLWILVGLTALTRLTLAERSARLELNRLEEPRRALRMARLAMDSAQAMLQALDHSRGERQKLAESLSALVSALPDSVMLTGLSLDTAGAGRLTGRVRGVAHLMNALERSSILAHPRLEGATVRDSLNGMEWERFSVRLGGDRSP